MKKQIHKNQAVKEIIVNEIHKPSRTNYPRRATAVKGLLDLFQLDLADMKNYHSYNNGFKYILVVICCFSKYVWTFPLKNKSALTTTTAMQKLLEQGHVPKNLQSDFGGEFYNSHFKKLISKYKINHYSTYTIMKAAIVERFIRSLKERLYKKFSLRGSYRWIDILDSTVNEYNHTKHRTIKMRPVDVNQTNEKLLFSKVFFTDESIRKTQISEK